MKSEAGHFIVETVELRVAFAASSASSLPRIPVWPGIQIVLEQKLLLRAYMKSYMTDRLVPKWMTLTFV